MKSEKVIKRKKRREIKRTSGRKKRRRGFGKENENHSQGEIKRVNEKLEREKRKIIKGGRDGERWKEIERERYHVISLSLSASNISVNL